MIGRFCHEDEVPLHAGGPHLAQSSFVLVAEVAPDRPLRAAA